MADGARIAAFVYAPVGVRDEPGTPFAVSWEAAPVVVLHGNGESHAHMAGLIERLARERSVIAIDSRGQGASLRGSSELSYELMAADVLEVMSRLGVTQAHVLGYSDGAIVAILLALAMPWRALSLTLIGANLSPEGLVGEALDGMRSALEGFELGRGVWYETRPDGDVGRCVSEWDASGSEPYGCEAVGAPANHTEEELLRLMLGQPHIDASQLSHIGCPAFVLAGEHDLIREDETRTIASALPRARLKIVAGAGHDLPHEAPYAVACCAREAMAAGEPRRRARSLLELAAAGPQVRGGEGGIFVRRASSSDEPRLLRLYERVLDACEGPGQETCGWKRGFWPLPEDVLCYLHAGATWVAVADADAEREGARILGATSLDHDFGMDGVEPEWEPLAWGESLTCHLLATDPGARGRGVATSLLSAYAREGRARGCHALRINTSPQSLSNRLYHELGFTLHKPVWFPYKGLFMTGWSNVYELRLDAATR